MFEVLHQYPCLFRRHLIYTDDVAHPSLAVVIVSLALVLYHRSWTKIDDEAAAVAIGGVAATVVQRAPAVACAPPRCDRLRCALFFRSFAL